MPLLPREIVWEIAQQAWKAPQTPLERKSLLSAVFLVSSEWTAMFLWISGTDVHIVDRRYMDYYFRLLRGDSILFNIGGGSGGIFNQLCRRLTVYITNVDLPSVPCPTEPEAEKLLSDFFYNVGALQALPNLKTTRIQFQNVSCEDIFQYHRLVDFPLQAEFLELEYTFTTLIPRWMIPMPHFLASGSNPSWILPSVRHLRIVGGFDDLMKMVFVCPKIESFEMDGCMYWDRRSKKDVRDDNLIRTLFFRGLPAQYEDKLPRHVEGQAPQKLFVFTEDPVKGDDGSLTYFWWLSHDFSKGDITDYENVQYISCNQAENGGSIEIPRSWRTVQIFS